MLTKEEKLSIGAVALSGFIMGLFHVACNDIWWHLKTADWMVENLSFPFADPFSYTTQGRPWIYHNWLFDLPLWVVHHVMGIPGIILVRAVFSSLIALSVYRLTRLRLPAPQAAILAVLVTGAIRVRFFIRPELATILLFVFLFWLLIRWLEEGVKDEKKALLLTAGVFIAWSNLHAGVIFGLILAGVFTVSAFMQKKDFAFFSKVTGVAALAGLVNPHLWNIYLYSFRYLWFKHEVGFQNEEHMPPPPFWVMPSLALYWLVGGMFTLIMLLRWHKMTSYLWILFLGFGYLSLTSFRGIPYFFIVLGFCVAHAWKDDLEKRGTKFADASVLIVVITLVSYVSQPFFFSFDVDERRRPYSATEFIKKNGLKGNMFNSHPFGGFLLYSLYPDYKVFVDGRDDVHFETFKRAKDLGFPAMLRAHHVQWMIVGYRDEILNHLMGNEWAVVFFDDVSVILALRDGDNQPLIEAKEYHHVTPFNMVEKSETADKAELALMATELERAVSESILTRGIGKYLKKVRGEEPRPIF